MTGAPASGAHMRKIPLTVAIVVALTAAPAWGQGEGGPCARAFPGSAFETAAPAGPVMVHGSGLTDPLTTRFAAEIRLLAQMVQQEMGGLDGEVAVCIFAGGLPLDGEALGWHPGLALHAAAFGEEGLVVLSAVNVGPVADGARHGLIHVAQWRVSNGEYPQPFAEDVKGWYRNRLSGRVAAVRESMIRQNVGLTEPWPPIPWTSGTISDPLLWNPKFSYGGAGDFTAYAVGAGGPEVLSDPSASRLAPLDEGWRNLLFSESGSIPGGSRGWIVGALLVSGVIVLAALLAYLGRLSRLRLERSLRQDAVSLTDTEGEEPAPAVRPSVAVGGRRLHSGVGGGVAGPPGIDRDHRDRPPAGGGDGADLDEVAPRPEPDDHRFRHPGFRDQG